MQLGLPSRVALERRGRGGSKNDNKENAHVIESGKQEDEIKGLEGNLCMIRKRLGDSKKLRSTAGISAEPTVQFGGSCVLQWPLQIHYDRNLQRWGHYICKKW